MANENKNVTILKAAYRLWNDTKGGSVDHWLDNMSDDVKFRSLAEGAKTIEFTRTSSCSDWLASWVSTTCTSTRSGTSEVSHRMVWRHAGAS